MAPPAAKIPVKFYFDVVSPYTVLAMEVMDRYRDRWNLEIDWTPVFLGGQG
jgi:glutathione S-transferase kappa 1